MPRLVNLNTGDLEGPGLVHGELQLAARQGSFMGLSAHRDLIRFAEVVRLPQAALTEHEIRAMVHKRRLEAEGRRRAGQMTLSRHHRASARKHTGTRKHNARPPSSCAHVPANDEIRGGKQEHLKESLGVTVARNHRRPDTSHPSLSHVASDRMIISAQEHPYPASVPLRTPLRSKHDKCMLNRLHKVVQRRHQSVLHLV